MGDTKGHTMRLIRLLALSTIAFAIVLLVGTGGISPTAFLGDLGLGMAVGNAIGALVVIRGLGR